jgi:transcriptional regulator with XRE-family HTH domain
MERAQLIAARHRKHWSLDEAAAALGIERSTLFRWEKGKTTPQPMHIRKLCEVYGLPARALDLEVPLETQNEPSVGEEEADVLRIFREQDLTLRTLRIVWSWSHHARYRDLQHLIVLEIEGNDTMQNDPMTRRDALRRLALLPIELCSLSALVAVFKRPNEEILAQCAAGIIACWQLRQDGRDLAFADLAVSKYIPTLKAIAAQGLRAPRKEAADLLVQCFLLKSTLAWAVSTIGEAVAFAKQAEIYGRLADQPMLEILALRKQAAAYSYVNQWGQALEAAQKAEMLLASARSPIHPSVQSYVYAGLATYEAYHGRKQEALRSLGKAHTTFFAEDDETIPIWVDHTIGNVLINDGQAHMHLGEYREALDSYAQIHASNDPAIPMECRVETFIDQAMAEVSRDDQARDMERCIAYWTKGIEGARALQSNQRMNEAIAAYHAMRVAWPGERRIKELREHIVRW